MCCPTVPLTGGGYLRIGTPHALLARGGQILDELFPGILNELVADGAPVWDDGELSKLYFSFGGHLLVRSGKIRNHKAMTAYMPSRPFLECHVRRRLRAIANVKLLGGHDAAELTSTADQSRVTGVQVVNREDGAEQELTADLVMDAMGRGAHTPALLERLGYGRPAEDHVVVHTTYVSQLLRIPPGTLNEVGAIISPAPGRPTGMFLSSYENDTWMFTVFGMAGQEPPRNLAGMLSFAEEYAPGPPTGGGAGRRTTRGGGTTPYAVQPVAALRQDAAISRRPAGLRRRDLQLQPDLRAGNERCRRSTLPPCGTVCVAAITTCPADTSAPQRNRLVWPGSWRRALTWHSRK